MKMSRQVFLYSAEHNYRAQCSGSDLTQILYGMHKRVCGKFGSIFKKKAFILGSKSALMNAHMINLKHGLSNCSFIFRMQNLDVFQTGKAIIVIL